MSEVTEELQAKFDTASHLIAKGIPQNNVGVNSDKLALYGKFKQAKDGDIEIGQPWAVQLEARAKWEAWNKEKGNSKAQAMENYVVEVTRQAKDFQIELPEGEASPGGYRPASAPVAPAPADSEKSDAAATAQTDFNGYSPAAAPAAPAPAAEETADSGAKEESEDKKDVSGSKEDSGAKEESSEKKDSDDKTDSSDKKDETVTADTHSLIP